MERNARRDRDRDRKRQRQETGTGTETETETETTETETAGPAKDQSARRDTHPHTHPLTRAPSLPPIFPPRSLPPSLAQSQVPGIPSGGLLHIRNPWGSGLSLSLSFLSLSLARVLAHLMRTLIKLASAPVLSSTSLSFFLHNFFSLASIRMLLCLPG